MASLLARIEVLRPKIASFTSRIEVLQPKIASLHCRIEVLQEKITSLQAKITVLLPKMASLHAEIGVLWRRFRVSSFELEKQKSEVRSQKAGYRRQRLLPNLRLQGDDLAVLLNVNRRAVSRSNSVGLFRGPA